jgi:hypothetical protein
MTPASAFLSRLVASLEADPALTGLPIHQGEETEERVLPYVVASATYGSGSHRRLREVELRLELVTQRDDTSETDRRQYHQTLGDHVEREAETIALALDEDGWRMRAWNLIEPFSEPSEEREWSSGFEYRVVLMEI